MLSDVHMLTGNAIKFAIAKDVFDAGGVSLSRLAVDCPEIQSMDVVEIAREAAVAMARTHGVPVFKTDVGFYFDALNGFPGPFIKFVHPLLPVQDWISLMRDKTNMHVNIREALVLAFPDGASYAFTDDLATEFTMILQGDGPTIDQVLIPVGYDKPIACYTADEQLERWKKNQTIYTQVVKFIKDYPA